MPSSSDIIQRNIQKQIALNSGQISISNINGSYQWVDNATGVPLPGTNDAGNYALGQAPAIYQSSMRAEVYNYAKGLFGGKEVPAELIEVLATMATYYSVQTGQSVTSLFNQGKLLPDFLSTINNLRNKTSQLGYAGLNLAPNWSNNPVLRASVAKAIEPWDAIGKASELQKYNSKPIGFTFYATDTNIVYIRVDPKVVYPTGSVRDPRMGTTWDIHEPDQPMWPA